MAAAIDAVCIDQLVAATRDVFRTMVFTEVGGKSPILCPFTYQDGEVFVELIVTRKHA